MGPPLNLAFLRGFDSASHYHPGVIPAPSPRRAGYATSLDGSRIAWKRYGEGEPAILVIPTWNLVDSRVVGHQVAALEPHATVVTYDARGVGASDRPERGYDFSLHAADARAVLEATGIGQVRVLSASRGFNAAVLLAAQQPSAVERMAVVGPYVQFEAGVSPDPARLEKLRTDWAGFIVPFMHTVFSEPQSDDLIEHMIAIGMEASPDVVATQETELDWAVPASLIPTLGCPALVIHGDSDAAVPPTLAERIVDLMPNARLELIAGGGHRPDIRNPEVVNPILLEFLVQPGA